MKKSSQWINFIKTLYVFIFQRNISCRTIFHTVVFDFICTFLVLLPGRRRFFTIEKLTSFNAAGFTSFSQDFHEQSTLAGAVESFNLRCTAVSKLSRRSTVWLQVEPKPAIHVQLPDSTHPLSLFKQTHTS